MALDNDAVGSLAEDVGGLRTAVTDLLDQVNTYEQARKDDKRKNRNKNLLFFASIILVGLAASYAVYNSIQNHNLIKNTNKINVSQLQVLHDIEQATGPTAQARSANSIAAILNAVDTSNRQELQQVINDIAFLLGKQPPLLQPIPAVTSPTTTTPSATTTTKPPSKSASSPRHVASPSPTTRAPPTTTQPPVSVSIPKVCVPNILCVQSVKLTNAASPQGDPVTNIPFVALAAMGALVFVVTNFLKYLTNRNWGAAATQVVVWVGGILVVVLVAQTQFASGISIGGLALAKLNWASLLMFGLLVGSLPSTVWTTGSLLASQPTAAAAKLFPVLPHITFSTTSPTVAVQVGAGEPEPLPIPDRVKAKRGGHLPPNA